MQSSSSFAKMFLYEREACSYIDKVYFAAVYIKKNNICTSCVFNGFKYSLMNYNCGSFQVKAVTNIQSIRQNMFDSRKSYCY